MKETVTAYHTPTGILQWNVDLILRTLISDRISPSVNDTGAQGRRVINAQCAGAWSLQQSRAWNSERNCKTLLEISNIHKTLRLKKQSHKSALLEHSMDFLTDVSSWRKLDAMHSSFTLPTCSIPEYFKIRLLARKPCLYWNTGLCLSVRLNEESPTVQCPWLLVRDDGVHRASHEQLFVSFPNTFINRVRSQSHKLHSVLRPFCIASFTRTPIEHLRGLL